MQATSLVEALTAVTVERGAREGRHDAGVHRVAVKQDRTGANIPAVADMTGRLMPVRRLTDLQA